MTQSTYLYDPNTYEILEDSADVVAAYNASESRSSLHISVEDQNDIRDMLLGEGIIKEAYIQ